LTDEQWATLEPLLPDRTPIRGGRVDGSPAGHRRGDAAGSPPRVAGIGKRSTTAIAAVQGTGRGGGCWASCALTAAPWMTASGRWGWMSRWSGRIIIAPVYGTSRRETSPPGCWRRPCWTMPIRPAKSIGGSVEWQGSRRQTAVPVREGLGRSRGGV